MARATEVYPGGEVARLALHKFRAMADDEREAAQCQGCGAKAFFDGSGRTPGRLLGEVARNGGNNVQGMTHVPVVSSAGGNPDGAAGANGQESGINSGWRVVRNSIAVHTRGTRGGGRQAAEAGRRREGWVETGSGRCEQREPEMERSEHGTGTAGSRTTLTVAAAAGLAGMRCAGSGTQSAGTRK